MPRPNEYQWPDQDVIAECHRLAAAGISPSGESLMKAGVIGNISRMRRIARRVRDELGLPTRKRPGPRSLWTDEDIRDECRKVLDEGLALSLGMLHDDRGVIVRAKRLQAAILAVRKERGLPLVLRRGRHGGMVLSTPPRGENLLADPGPDPSESEQEAVARRIAEIRAEKAGVRDRNRGNAGHYGCQAGRLEPRIGVRGRVDRCEKAMAERGGDQQ